MTAPMHLPQFVVKQKLTMMVNRYQVLTLGADGSTGQLMAFAEQKRMAFKEQVTFFTDETGGPLGFFRKDFGASLLRSTFHVEGPGYAGTGQERSQLVALLRRFVDIPFLPVHFDFVGSDGAPLLTIERQATVRDLYTVSAPDQRVDFRVAASVAVALDALMSR